MRNKNAIILTITVTLVWQLSFAQTKHALIFAIGDYPKASGWQKISSDNDTLLVEKALMAQKFQDIKVVHDKDATVNGISTALEALIAISNPGDVDVIHFSSHGEQIEDLKKHKADGLEECIVPYDAKLPDADKRPYTQEYIESLFPGYYREDMFGAYVDKLRAKLGRNGDLVVFLDLCHAGAGTRGSARIRGGHSALVTPSFTSKSNNETALATVFGNDADPKMNDPNLATYVVFGAARADELDCEMQDENGNGLGSLSYAISKVFLNLTKDTKSDITYRSLFAQIQSILYENVPNQHPVLAGNGADRLLFGGKIITQKPYLEINKISDNNLTLRGGKIMGLDSGAKVSLYPSGTNDPKNAKPIDTGSVVRATLFTSEATFNKPVNLKNPVDGWVFVNSTVYDNFKLKIGISSSMTRRANSAPAFSEAEVRNIKHNLTTLPIVSFAGSPDIKIVKGDHLDSIIIAHTGVLFDTIKSAGRDTAGLKRKIARYIQYTYLENIKLKDTDAMVDIKLIPVGNGAVVSSKNRSADQSYTFKNGDKFRLLITNNGKQDVYVNILDLQPDGVINPLLPNQAKRITPEELLFPAGTSKLFNSVITISPPYGKETFKIFVSTDLINMEDIATTRGVSSRGGNLKILEKLVQKSYDRPLQRGAGVELDNNDANGSTFNLYFDIVRKD